MLEIHFKPSTCLKVFQQEIRMMHNSKKYISINIFMIKVRNKCIPKNVLLFSNDFASDYLSRAIKLPHGFGV